MPRQIDFAGSSEECSLLLERLKQHPGVARITVQLAASRDPDGDIVTVEAANHSSIDILNILTDLHLLHSGAVTISEPNASIRSDASRSINEEGNDAVWEEMSRERLRLMRVPAFTSVTYRRR